MCTTAHDRSSLEVKLYDCVPAARAHEEVVYFESEFKLMSWPDGQECALLKGPAWEERGKTNKADSVQTTKVQ